MMTRRKVYWIAGLLLGLPALAPAQNIAIGSYPVTPPNTSGPNAITKGPDGAVHHRHRQYWAHD